MWELNWRGGRIAELASERFHIIALSALLLCCLMSSVGGKRTRTGRNGYGELIPAKGGNSRSICLLRLFFLALRWLWARLTEAAA